MPRLKPTEHDHTHGRSWLLGGVVCLCVLVVTIIVVTGLLLQNDTASGSEYTQAQLLEQMLGVVHDELFMLVVSLAVVIEIAANFGFFQRIPCKVLLLSSFAGVALSAFCTVVESLVFPEVLNYVEHLSFMAASILLAVWCWCVFGSKKQEGS